MLPAREGAVTEVDYFAPNYGSEKKSGDAMVVAGRTELATAMLMLRLITGGQA